MGLATQIHHIRNPCLNFLAWAIYSFLQGLVFTGLWEIAHECGHGALSPYKWVNNAIGLFVHSLLLVPFYSWRLTHAQHHKATNNLERDIAFVPDRKADYLAARESHSKFWEVVEDTPIVALVTLFFHQLIAWPIYLSINNFALPRMKATPWYKRSHFYLGGDGPNFKPANGEEILISDLGIASMAVVLWVCVDYFGAENVALFYLFPYLWTNHWIRK
jgi:omega-6 fatty acid desaturase (delta-12 desaturase)